MRGLEQKFNGDLYINKKQGRRDFGKIPDREKQIRKIMKEEGVTWSEASRRLK